MFLRRRKVNNNQLNVDRLFRLRKGTFILKKYPKLVDYFWISLRQSNFDMDLVSFVEKKN